MPRGDIKIYQDGSWSVSMSGEKGECIAEAVLEFVKTNQEAWGISKGDDQCAENY